jgi:hypothetical protein
MGYFSSRKQVWIALISNTFVGQALADNGCQEQNGPIPNIQNQSWPNPTTAGGMS